MSQLLPKARCFFEGAILLKLIGRWLSRSIKMVPLPLQFRSAVKVNKDKSAACDNKDCKYTGFILIV